MYRIFYKRKERGRDLAMWEFKKYMENIFGISFPEEEREEIADHSIYLSNGETTLFQNTEENNELGEEEFLIQKGEGTLRIKGGSRRALFYGIYSFLEKFLGVRYYMPGHGNEIVPFHDFSLLEKLLEEQLSLKECPSFSYRERIFFKPLDFHDYEGTSLMPLYIDWMVKNKMNVVCFSFRDPKSDAWQEIRRHFPQIKERGLKIGVHDHAWSLFLSPETYFDKYPEWFPEIEGKRVKSIKAQFCLSNSQARETLIENVLSFVKENPEIDRLAIWPNDYKRWCQCRRCRRSTRADLYLRFDNELAKRIRELNPGLRIFHMAYSSHIQPPEETEIGEGVDIDFCMWGRDYAYPFNHYKEGEEYMRKWKELCRGKCSLVLHEKYLRSFGLGYHLLPLKAYEEDLPYFKEMGIAGLDLHSGMMGWWVKGLNAYTLAKYLWNVNTSRQEVVEDFFSKYYAGVEEKMKRVYYLLESPFSDLRYWVGNISCPYWARQSGDKSPPGWRKHYMKTNEALRDIYPLLEEVKKEVKDPLVLKRIATLWDSVKYLEENYLVLSKMGEGIELLKEGKEGKARTYLSEALSLYRKNRHVLLEDKEGIGWEEEFPGEFHEGVKEEEMKEVGEVIEDWRNKIGD